MQITRRRFFKGTAAFSMPLFGIGCASKGFVARRPSPDAKLRLGLVGCGSRMVQGLVTATAGERIVAACDPDASRLDALRTRLAQLGRNDEIAGIRAFRDWREMLDSVGDELDAVIVATPNHQHVRPAVAAMKLGIGVYLEKPMALTIEEVRVLCEAQRRYPVATQVGNQGHSNEGTRLLVEYVKSGMLGQVHDVWFWDCRVNAFDLIPPLLPVPPSFDWDAWQGAALPQEFRAGIHLHDWHDWKIYGNGSIGNTGTHFFDPAFWALDLYGVSPVDVRLVESRPGAAGSWNVRNTIEWNFPARKGLDPVRFHWHDGLKDGIPMDEEHLGHWNNCRNREWQNVPPVVEELEKRHGVNLGKDGFLIVGEKGAIRLGSGGDGVVLVPGSLRKELGRPPRLIPRERRFTHMSDLSVLFVANARPGADSRLHLRWRNRCCSAAWRYMPAAGDWSGMAGKS